MSLFNEDRDVAVRLKEQERFIGFTGHAHSGPNARGWRAERDHAMRLEQDKSLDAQNDRRQINWHLLHRIGAGIRRLVWNT